MWFITARPAVGAAGIIVMSVGINTELRHLDPANLLVEYVVLTLAAVGIGSLLGFIVVPAWRPRDLLDRVGAAVELTAQLLVFLGDRKPGDAKDLEPLQASHHAIHQLTPDHDRLTDEQERVLAKLHTSLRDLVAVAVFVTERGRTSSVEAARRAALELVDGTHRTQGSEGGEPLDRLVVLLARETHVLRRDLTAELAG